MRVLWFVHSPVPAMRGRGPVGDRAHWSGALLAQLAGQPGLDLGVATAAPGFQDQVFTTGGVQYFIVGQPRRFPAFGLRARDLERCAAIVRDFRPDLIHFHGTERFFALLRAEGHTQVPAVVSLQGVLNPCATRRGFFGALSAREILAAIRLVELPLRLGLAWDYAAIRRAARRETRMLGAMEGVLGRTSFDEAWTRALSPGARYFHVGEVLRPEFWQARWQAAGCDRHTIIYSNSGHPRRGTENLLAAVALLRTDFPDVKLRLAGSLSQRSGYGRFLRRRIRDLGLQDRVDLLGSLDGTAMAAALARSHVFAITSYIENSPNSLAEAMLTGMPCVASAVGGIPSMVTHERTGLLYPVDDVPLLAESIRRVFTDDALAERLGREARAVATARHDPEVVVGQLLAAYRQVLGDDDRAVGAGHARDPATGHARDLR